MVLDTSSQALGSSTPNSLVPAALGVPSSSRAEDASSRARVEDTFKPVATSSQVLPWAAMPGITKPIHQTLEVVMHPDHPTS